MTDSARLDRIESAIYNQGEKIDRLADGFVALASHDERISNHDKRIRHLTEEQEETRNRVHTLECQQASHQARRDTWLNIIKIIPVVILVCGAAVTLLKLALVA